MECKEYNCLMHQEVVKLFDLAQLVDSLNPTLPGAFTGTPSERLKRQLEYHNILPKDNDKIYNDEKIQQVLTKAHIENENPPQS